jgi:hypothetical protein
LLESIESIIVLKRWVKYCLTVHTKFEWISLVQVMDIEKIGSQVGSVGNLVDKEHRF